MFPFLFVCIVELALISNGIAAGVGSLRALNTLRCSPPPSATDGHRVPKEDEAGGLFRFASKLKIT